MSTTAEHPWAGAATSPVREEYTPHGYLDVRGHTSSAPKGVVRVSGNAFTWHVPALGGNYGGSRERYRLTVRLRLPPGPGPTCSYNTSRVKVLHFRALRSTWFLAGDDALCLTLETEGGAVEAAVDVTYTRLLAAEGHWGESGLVGSCDRNGVLLQGFEGGEAFLLHGDAAPERVAFDHAEQQTGQVASAVRIGAAGTEATLTAQMRWRVSVGRSATITLTRGMSDRQARHRQAVIGRAADHLRAHLEADAQFWADAPRLTGDWPAHWRHGLHYDLETLRMVVKDPAGIFTYPWDAMQVQAPRVVLAEAALDALALSRADPRLAGEMFLGTFADAPAPQVPCVREDGSDTMVSADGTSCGTGPEWGLPFLVAELLDARLGDDGWLTRLYPLLCKYLEFWLTHRRDDQGWLVHACSWESGQDLSPRFGDQPLGGGHPTWHLRPVDLHAAAAHGARVLARFAARVQPADHARWTTVAEDLAARTRRLWAGGRFADHDATGPTAVDDVMLLLPVALDIADADQQGALADRVRSLTADSLTWPAPTWVALLALQRVGGQHQAGEHVAALLDRVYRRMDSRDPVDGALPGVAHEYWPTAGTAGGEAYGWGAFTTELFFAVVLGLEVDRDGIRLRPQLPPALRSPGLSLGVTLTVQRYRIGLTLRPIDAGLRVSGLGATARLAPGQSLHRTWAQLDFTAL